jgi:glycogen debranching enzyme
MSVKSAIQPSIVPQVEAVTDQSFYIPAEDPLTRPRRTLKHDDSFLVLDSHGDIGTTAGGADGLFHCDTRHLSRLELLVNGAAPLLLGFNMRDDNLVLNVDLTNPDIYKNERIAFEKSTLHIVRTIFLWQSTAYQRLAVTNHGDRPIAINLTLGFGNDFADLFEVRGLKRARHGSVEAEIAGADTVSLRCEGLDGNTRYTTLRFEPLPTRLAPGAAEYRLTLAPMQHIAIFLSAECSRGEAGKSPRFFKAMIQAHHKLKAVTRNTATVTTSNDVFNEVLCRAMADLYMLMTNTPQGPYPYAGIPWYSTTFGRDGIITALEMLWLDPSVARGVLRRLAAYQAKGTDPANDAQPGKILHEMRGGEMAALREVPFGQYYGSVDSTPLFVMLAGLYVERTGDQATLAELWPAVEAALGWIDGPADPDRDGFLEYNRMSMEGLPNQGWKDSHDAIFHADGRLAEGPIALAEVQGYVYLAKLLAAKCARRLGHGRRALALEEQAARLAERFEAAFWCPELDTYALALDGTKDPCRVRSSNAGQLLFTGIVRPERAAKVADGLLRPHFFSGWGIRTLAGSEHRYNPMSYHNGSVWPHDNALIALGLARYGLKRAAAQVFTGLYETATYMELRRLPELFCGFQRRRGRGPTLYPVACLPQAWASGAPFLMLQACLGLEFDSQAREIRLRSPCLPAFLDEIALVNLSLNDACVDLALRREANNDVSLRVSRTSGDIRVSLV